MPRRAQPLSEFQMNAPRQPGDPSAAQIREACAAIQLEWSERERRTRAGIEVQPIDVTRVRLILPAE